MIINCVNTQRSKSQVESYCLKCTSILLPKQSVDKSPASKPWKIKNDIKVTVYQNKVKNFWIVDVSKFILPFLLIETTKLQNAQFRANL